MPDDITAEQKKKYFSLFENLKGEREKALSAPPQTADSNVLIVDGLNTFLRVWTVYPSTNEDGQHVGGLIGFLKSIGHAVRLLKPTRCVVVFDGEGGSAYRKSLYPNYKNRSNPKTRINRALTNQLTATDEEVSLKWQGMKLVEYLNLMPVTQICINNIEADDVIGFLASEYFDGEYKHVTIMSTDKDFLQLTARPNITVYSPTKKKLYAAESLKKEYGISASNFIMYRMLDGDPSDCIKGIYGLGEKKIKKLFPQLAEDQKVGIDELLKIAEEKKNECKLYERVTESRSTLELNLKLMSLLNAEIPGVLKCQILDKVREPIHPLNKFEIINKFNEDKLWGAFPDLNVWMTKTWGIINNFAQQK